MCEIQPTIVELEMQLVVSFCGDDIDFHRRGGRTENVAAGFEMRVDLEGSGENVESMGYPGIVSLRARYGGVREETETFVFRSWD